MGDFAFEGAYVTVAYEIDQASIQQNLEDGLSAVPIPTANGPEKTYTSGFFAGLDSATGRAASGINWESLGSGLKPQAKVDRSALEAAIKELQQGKATPTQRPGQPTQQQPPNPPQKAPPQSPQPSPSGGGEDCQCECCDPGEQSQTAESGSSTSSSSNPNMSVGDFPALMASLSNGNSQGANSEFSSPPQEGAMGGYSSIDPNSGPSASEYLNGPAPTNMDSESSLPEEDPMMNPEAGGITTEGLPPEVPLSPTTPEEEAAAAGETDPLAAEFDPNSFDIQG